MNTEQRYFNQYLQLIEMWTFEKEEKKSKSDKLVIGCLNNYHDLNVNRIKDLNAGKSYCTSCKSEVIFRKRSKGQS